MGTEATDAARRAVLQDPREDEARLRFAEVCGDPPRAALIRAQLEARRLRKQGSAGWTVPYREAKALIEAHGDRWAEAVAPLVDDFAFHGGFVGRVTLDAARFLEVAEALYRVAPIEHLTLKGVTAVAGELFASRHLSRIVSLSMVRQKLGDAVIEELARSPHLGSLLWLDLGFNRITRAGYEALLKSDALPALRYLNETGNPGGELCQGSGADFVDGSIGGALAPPWVRALEKEHGRREWVYWADRFGRIPSRDDV